MKLLAQNINCANIFGEGGINDSLSEPEQMIGGGGLMITEPGQNIGGVGGSMISEPLKNIRGLRDVIRAPQKYRGGGGAP